MLRIFSLLVLFLYCQHITSAHAQGDFGERDRVSHLQEQLQLLDGTVKDLLAQINNLKNSTESTISKLQDQVTIQTDQLNKLEGLQNTIVPVGFIYTQLPGQPEPYRIWDTVYWIDISSEYAGLFFRVLGGNSEKFNVTQVENSPRLFHVNTQTKPPHNYNIDVVANGLPSEGVTTGAHGSAGTWRLQFQVSSGEVRPRNQAVRIWKRSR